ncbi:hypothetical protein [Thalassobaculum salexigens]|uniref:hypothetical protein n=1 Tax=Thalassobaculum salexigens TaxID=455360 RepID=UPI0004147174|nr:hypothetical protein [Thalassobaculum salexigens]
MRPLLAAFLLGLLALPAGPAGAAEDAGLDWQSVQAEESKIVIDLPDAKGGGIFLRAMNDSFSSTFHVARYKTDKFRLDRAMLVYLELQPGYHFRSARSTDRVLKWRVLQSADIDLGQKLQIVTERGALDVQRFRLEDRVECAALAQTWGGSASETTSAGTEQILGYMCEEPDVAVTRERIERVAQAIIVRD